MTVEAVAIILGKENVDKIHESVKTNDLRLFEKVVYDNKDKEFHALFYLNHYCKDHTDSDFTAEFLMKNIKEDKTYFPRFQEWSKTK